MVAPQYANIYRISQEVGLPVLAQHIDAVEAGGHTGSILPESVKEAGAVGTLINHSEQRKQLFNIDATIKKAFSLEMSSRGLHK